MDDRSIVIFDGVCVFCNGTVNFIIERDSKKRFAFTPMQTEFAKQLVQQHDSYYEGVDTLLLIKQGRCYAWADAVLEITKDLDGCWYLLTVFKIIPPPVRNFCYRQFAKNRYRLFGKTASCMVPSPEVSERFLGL